MSVGFAVGGTLERSARAVRQVETVHQRFSRWCHAGVWERVFAALTADRDNHYLMIDSTIIRAHQQAASGKGGPKIRRWGVPEAD